MSFLDMNMTDEEAAKIEAEFWEGQPNCSSQYFVDMNSPSLMNKWNQITGLLQYSQRKWHGKHK